MFKTKAREFLELTLGLTLKTFPRLKNIITDKLTIFVYHDITDTPSNFSESWGLSVSIKTFQNQVSWISNNFNIIHPNDLLNKSSLPDKSAVITFDDGFAGTFRNGIPYLVKRSIPSVIYLNMGSIIKDRPIASAIIDYLGKHSLTFKSFVKKHNLSEPYFLSMTPSLLYQYENDYGPLDLTAIGRFQGPFANISMIKNWCENNLVVFGNHLYDHWNSKALTDNEFKEQYLKNECALKKLNITDDLFAFTNGQPGSCFGTREINLLRELGAKKVFFSSGQTNHRVNDYLLDRVGLSDLDHNNNYLWFKMFRLFLTRNKQLNV